MHRIHLESLVVGIVNALVCLAAHLRIPDMKVLYCDLGVCLPALTEAIMAISDGHGWAFLSVVMLIFFPAKDLYFEDRPRMIFLLNRLGLLIAVLLPCIIAVGLFLPLISTVGDIGTIQSLGCFSRLSP